VRGLIVAWLAYEWFGCVVVKARREIEKTLPGIADVDIDLELDETS